MYVIAKGEGVYKNFDEDKITLDFIPCQNPEGFIVVTEALRPYIDKLTEKEFEKLSEEYYLNYRKDDRVYLEINKLLSSIDENNKNQNINNIPNIQTKIDELFQNLSELGISGNIIPKEKSILLKDIDNINDALACSYQKFTDYNIMPYPKLLSGTGDMIRQMLPGSLIIELSKMGGNPLGPYGDKEDNYKKVINTNLLAFHEILNVVENKIKIK